jgi:hypothetical protein
MKQYTVSLYGWDLNAQWHGPDEIEVGVATALVRKLRPRTGWYSGQLCCCDDLQMNVHAAVRDLGDAVIAILDFPDSPGAPAQVLAIVAAHRRARVRSDFAFNFTCYLALLDAVGEEAELPVHEGIEQAMTEQAADANLVFTITSTTMPCEFAIGMAATTECVIGSVLAWVEEIDGTDLASRQLVPTSNSTSSGISNSA